jgi:hypothetical protein
VTIAEITTKSQEALQRAKLEADMQHKLQVSADTIAMQEDAQQHEKELSVQEHEQTLEQGQQGHEQALEQGDQAGAQQQALAAQQAEQQPQAAQ